MKFLIASLAFAAVLGVSMAGGYGANYGALSYGDYAAGLQPAVSVERAQPLYNIPSTIYGVPSYGAIPSYGPSPVYGASPAYLSAPIYSAAPAYGPAPAYLAPAKSASAAAAAASVKGVKVPAGSIY